jgi:hypothetical protein
MLFALALMAMLYFSGATPGQLIDGLVTAAGWIVTAFSVLAGFNTTSLTIFTTNTSGSSVLRPLKRELIEGTRHVKLEQVIAYFSWSIVSQLAFLLATAAAALVFGDFSPLRCALLSSAVGYGAVWLIDFILLFGLAYAVVLTIRNMSILHLFLVAEARSPAPSDNK